MKGITKISLTCFLLLFLACREKYTPALNLLAPSYLVVEGFINNGTGPTTITLTRTTSLTVNTTFVYETKATAFVEGALNTTGFPLTETTKGVYTNPQLTLNPAEQYRIHIKTLDGKEYLSDYSAVRSTPAIDSISWRRENSENGLQANGVQIYANTHDAQGKTKYYQFTYDETWEYHSQYTTTLKAILNSRGDIIGVAYRDPVTLSYDSTQYKCWQKNSLTGILVNSSEKLVQDVIHLQPLVYIPFHDWKLSVLYSINVKQYALSKEKYRFLEQLKKNTEQVGTTFDQQPSDNVGNLHCVSNTAEPVIGFMEVSQEKQQRIYISNVQVPDWFYQPGCDAEMPIPNDPTSLLFAGGMGLLPTNPAETSPTGGITKVAFATPVCIDCRLRGSNVKPAFWP